MTLTCADCTAEYAVGIRRCPQCRSERIVREDNDMPKITVHGGPSDAADLPDNDEGGEQSSPGTSSSTSPESSQTKPEQSETGQRRQSRARTTESRSKKDQTGSRSAASTDGAQTGASGKGSSQKR